MVSYISLFVTHAEHCVCDAAILCVVSKPWWMLCRCVCIGGIYCPGKSTRWGYVSIAPPLRARRRGGTAMGQGNPEGLPSRGMDGGT